MSDQLACTVCGRDYELPRRYMFTLGDFDFSPIPRLLPCLHTLCHSCIEDQLQKQSHNAPDTTDRIVQCPLCRCIEAIKGASFLPLDISALKQVVNTSSAQLLATCARCYDQVPSVSWCETCSSALCEFHHQDHKLSVETAKHSVNTFKEYLHAQKKIEYCFPPVHCPEFPFQDCELYCSTCAHLVSAKAAIEGHRDHVLSNYRDVLSDMSQLLSDATEQAAKYSQTLKRQVEETRKLIEVIDDEQDACILNIGKAFQALYSQLQKREKRLIQETKRLLDDKRQTMIERLTALGELQEECEFVLGVGSSLKRDTQSREVEGMYMVAAAEAISFRSDAVCEAVDKKLSSLMKIEPKLALILPQHSLELLQQSIDTFGAVSCREEDSPLRQAMQRSLEQSDTSQPTDAAAVAELPMLRFSVATSGVNEVYKREAASVTVVEVHLVTSQVDAVAGRVVFAQEIDREVRKKCRIKEFYDTISDQCGRPALRIVKELRKAESN